MVKTTISQKKLRELAELPHGQAEIFFRENGYWDDSKDPDYSEYTIIALTNHWYTDKDGLHYCSKVDGYTEVWAKDETHAIDIADALTIYEFDWYLIYDEDFDELDHNWKLIRVELSKDYYGY